MLLRLSVERDRVISFDSRVANPRVAGPRTTIGRVEFGAGTHAGPRQLFSSSSGAAGNTADDYWGPSLLVLFVVALNPRISKECPCAPGTSRERGGGVSDPGTSRLFLGSSDVPTVRFVGCINVGKRDVVCLLVCEQLNLIMPPRVSTSMRRPTALRSSPRLHIV